VPAAAAIPALRVYRDIAVFKTAVVFVLTFKGSSDKSLDGQLKS